MNAIEEPVIYSCQGFGQIDRAANSPPPPLVERCVVVARQQDGYGLRVTGGFPVKVEYITPNGAAFVAGVCEGDCILKVNGMPVTPSNHQEVLRMISGGYNVALTLLGPRQPSFGYKFADRNYSGESNKNLISNMDEESDENEVTIPEPLKQIAGHLSIVSSDDESTSTRGTHLSNRQHETQLEVAKKENDNTNGIISPFTEANMEPYKVEPPVKSWVESGGMHYVHVQANSVAAEDNETDISDVLDSDQQDTMESFFSDLQDLKTRPAQLSVFMNYLIRSGNPNNLLFYLITDHYSSSNVKEIRRFAYEIFSTFIIPNAPLQIPSIGQRLIQQIDKVLRAASAHNRPPSDIEQLRRVFIGPRTKAIGEINEQLAEFKRKRQMGLPIYGGMRPVQINSLARGDGHRISENILLKILEELLENLFCKNRETHKPASLKELFDELYHATQGGSVMSFKNCDSTTLALIISIVSIIKVVICLKSSNSAIEKLLDKCPTFLTPSKGSSSTVLTKIRAPIMLGSKRVIQVKDHHFILNPVFLTVYCYHCRELVWGVQPHAYFCQSCDVVVHRQCTSNLVDNCYPIAQQKTSSRGVAGLGRLKSQVSASSVSLNKQHAQIAQSSTGTLQHLNLSQAYEKQHRISISDAQSAITSISGYTASKASVTEPPSRHRQRHYRYHQKESLSLTPPLPRSFTPEKEVANTMKDNSHRYPSGNDLILRHGVAGSITSPPSSPHSSTFLPPPALNKSFERFSAQHDLPPPDLPPPPPPPVEPPDGNAFEKKPLSSTVKQLVSPQVPHQPGKSVSTDSGIGHDAIHANKNLPRTQSTKSDGTTQVRRLGHIMHSFTDSTTNSSPLFGVTEEGSNAYEQQSLTAKTSCSNLTVPEPTRSASSSANDLQQLLPPTNFDLLAPSPTFGVGLDDIPSVAADENEVKRMFSEAESIVIEDDDSDFEVENEVPSLDSLLKLEVIKHMKPKEKKRQEVINELFHTERTHLRNLKVIFKMFYKPMLLQHIVQPKMIKLLFGNLAELLEIHSVMFKKMKEARATWKGTLNGLCGEIGELVVGIFSGPSGEKLMNAAANFCAHQQFALDALRQKYNRSRGDPFSMFLSEAESNPLCRKFQLKDMIPIEMMRLVKYPLLLENIAKYTPDPSEELQRIQNGIQGAKQILSTVNSTKRSTENQRKLEDLQRRLDLGGAGEGAVFFQKFDFRSHNLLHEGPLVWRQSRGKNLDLHVVLLEHLLVFLSKTNDSSKLQLKIHETSCIPIMKLASVEVEERTSDKRAFSLLYKCDLRLFELIAPTQEERKTWYRLISNQTSLLRSRPMNETNGFGSFGATDQASPPQMARARVVGDDTDGGGLVTAKVEQVCVFTHPSSSMVGANEILIQQPMVVENQKAPQGITHCERLRRQDEIIIKALAEKQNILAEILLRENKGNKEELEKIVDFCTGLSVSELKQRNPKELAMSAIVHGNRLLESISKGMSPKPKEKTEIDETERHLPFVPCYKLTAIAAPLINHLKALMQIIQDQESENISLRQQIRLQEGEGAQVRDDLKASTATGNTFVLKSIPRS